VEDAWVRPAAVEGGNGAGFLTLINETGEKDALLSAEADFANSVEIHQSVMGDNDTMSMVPVDQIDLPRGETVKLEPGGYHIMLMGIDQALEPGSTVTIALNFEKAGRFEIPFEVREQ
jgi:copper(I)-binding protein